MIKLDEDALICDLAEVYQIYEYRRLSIYQVAVFACGLPNSSRIKLKMANQKVDDLTLILAQIFDGINTLIWQNTKEGRKNINKPKSLFKSLTEPKPESDVSTFNTSEDFESYRNELVKRVRGGERWQQT